MLKKKPANRETDSTPHRGSVARPLKLPALQVKQGNQSLYMFTAKASVLYGALSINRRVADKDEGYQRVLSPSRVEALTRFVLRKTIPGAVIVSLDSATFSKGEMTIPAGTDVGWVIDGQHRLAGANEAARQGTDIELPVVAFVGLSKSAQIEQFITINKEAKNVPTSLYLDLLHHLPNRRPADIAKERATDIATQLRKDEQSPFYERIVITIPPKSGQTISLVNFVRKISIHMAPRTGILNAYTEREQLGVISNYYQGLRQVFPKEYESKDSMFFKTLGFGAIWNVFPTFFSITLKNQKGFTVKDVVASFTKVQNLDFSTWSQYGTGDQAERTAADDIKASLLMAFTTEEDGTTALKL